MKTNYSREYHGKNTTYNMIRDGRIQSAKLP